LRKKRRQKREEEEKNRKGKKEKERSREALEQSGVPIRTAKHSVNSRFVRLCLIGASEPLLLRKKIVRKS